MFEGEEKERQSVESSFRPSFRQDQNQYTSMESTCINATQVLRIFLANDSRSETLVTS